MKANGGPLQRNRVVVDLRLGALKEGWTWAEQRRNVRKSEEESSVEPAFKPPFGGDDMAVRVAKCHGSRRCFCVKHGETLKI